MSESSEVGSQLESPKFPEINVKYELAPRQSPFMQIDGQLLGKVLEEAGYSSSIASPIVVTDKAVIFPGELARYDSIKGQVIINQNTIMSMLRDIREGEHRYLDGVKTSNFKRFRQIVSGYLNPISLPYMTLPDYGAVHHFSGSAKRRNRYLAAAKEGFSINRNGVEVKLSKEESVERAKQVIDNLIERATPGAIGWVIAHEFEHRNKAKTKRAIGIGLTLGPFLAGAATTSGSPADSANVLLGFLGSYLGYVVGRRMDEKASYDMANKSVQSFARAIQVNHQMFQEKVLNKTSTPTN